MTHCHADVQGFRFSCSDLAAPFNLNLFVALALTIARVTFCSSPGKQTNISANHMKNYNVGHHRLRLGGRRAHRGINATSQAKVTAVCSSRKLDSAKLSKQHGGKITCYTDLKKMLRQSRHFTCFNFSYPYDHARTHGAAARASI